MQCAPPISILLAAMYWLVLWSGHVLLSGGWGPAVSICTATQEAPCSVNCQDCTGVRVGRLGRLLADKVSSRSRNMTPTAVQGTAGEPVASPEQASVESIMRMMRTTQELRHPS